MRFFLSLLVLFQIPLNPPGGGTPPRFHALADWTLTANDRDWLERYYLPSRFEESRSLVAWAYGTAAPELANQSIDVELHSTLFAGSEGFLVAGNADPPGILQSVGLVPLHIQVAWDRENSQRLIVSHEFAHLVAFYTYRDGWEDFGHGTARDPFLVKLLGLARRVYIPGHSYDPFKAGTPLVLADGGEKRSPGGTDF